LNKVLCVKKYIVLFVGLVMTLNVTGQSKMTVAGYIQKYQHIAVEEMKLYKIPASITMAQGILESANGNSELARNANNHFGIKCKVEWTGEKYYYDDDAENECFRKYKSDRDSYRDHSLFLTTRKYYTGLFSLDIMDYKAWAYGLKKAGYATEPKYAEMLIKIIEENLLFKLDSGQLIGTQEALAANNLPSAQQPLTPQTEVKRTPDSLNKVAKIRGINNGPDDFPDIQLSDKKREVLVNNGVKYIIAEKQDTYQSVADYFGLAEFDILRYNDIKNKKPLMPGAKVYIESKKKSAAIDFHVAGPGETMQDISQLYAVQMKELYKKNRMKQGTQPRQGQKLWLTKPMPVY